MDDATRTTVGYAVVGLVIGLLLHPWIYTALVRSETALVTEPMWIWTFLGLILAPALLFYLVGRSRVRREPVA